MAAMRSIIVLVALFAAAPALAERGLNFNGVPLGVGEQELRKAVPDFVCVNDRAPYDRMCLLFPSKAMTTYGGAPFSMITAHFLGGKLAHVVVDLDSNGFKRVARTLSSELGQPSDVKSDGRMAWVRGGAVLVATPTARSGTSTVHLISASLAATQTR